MPNVLNTLQIRAGYPAEITLTLVDQATKLPVTYLDEFSSRAQIRTDYVHNGGELVIAVDSIAPNANGDLVVIDDAEGQLILKLSRATMALLSPDEDYFLEVQAVDLSNNPSEVAQAKLEILPTAFQAV